MRKGAPHDELGLESEKPGDGDPPFLTTREVGGIGRKFCRFELDEREELFRPMDDRERSESRSARMKARIFI